MWKWVIQGRYDETVGSRRLSWHVLPISVAQIVNNSDNLHADESGAGSGCRAIPIEYRWKCGIEKERCHVNEKHRQKCHYILRDCHCIMRCSINDGLAKVWLTGGLSSAPLVSMLQAAHLRKGNDTTVLRSVYRSRLGATALGLNVCATSGSNGNSCAESAAASSIPMLFVRATNAPPKIASRSRIKYRGAWSHGNASRICCAVHSSVGRSVTLKCTTRRRSWERTTKTNSTRNCVGARRSGGAERRSRPAGRHGCEM